MNQLTRWRIIYALKDTTTTIQIAHHITHKFFWCDCLNFHNRLKNHWFRASSSFLKSHGTCDFKRHFAGIHFMERAIIQSYLHIYHWITSNDTVLKLFLNTFVNSWYIFSRNNTTNNAVFKFIPLTRLLWLNFNPNVTILATTTGLTYVFSFLLY